MRVRMMKKTNANITVHCFIFFFIVGIQYYVYAGIEFIVLLLPLFRILCELNNGVGLTKIKNRSIV